MTTGTINITLHSPELVSVIKQLAEALAGRPAPLPNEPAQEIAAPVIEAAIPTIPQTPAVVPAVPVVATASVSPVQGAAVLPTPAQSANPVPVSAAPTYTLEALARAGAVLAQSGKMEEALALLTKYGVQTIHQLAPDQYGAFATELRALGAQV